MASTTTSLSDLPADILLYMLRFCDLADNLSLSTVCTTFYNLSQQRGYWINALQEARLIRPIACPLREDLTKRDFQSLKRIAFHTVRLEYNWSPSLPQPQIKGPIKAVVLGVPLLDVIFQVPGTELYVFHSRSSGTIAAWDIRLGRRVSPETFISNRVLDVSPGQDEPGKFSMGLLTLGPLSNELVVICLEYGPEGVNLSLTMQYRFEPNMYHWAVFMTTGYVGVLRCDMLDDDETSTVDIIALNLSSQRMTTIQTDISREMFAFDAGQSGTSILDGNLFILVEWMDESHLFRCPNEYLPHDDNPMCPPNSVLKCRDTCSSFKWKQDPGVEFIDTEGALSSDEFYGIPAVSLHRILLPREKVVEEGEDIVTEERNRSHIQIRFWTRPRAEDNHLPPHLSHNHSINIPGCLQDSPDSSWQLMLIPHSGRKVLIVVDFDSLVRLMLVHFDPNEDKLSVQPIALPPFIDIEEVYGLSLDDHKGVITLLDTRGVLYAIPYA